MNRLLHKIVRGLDRFLFESCDPRVVPILRIGFALMIILQALVLWPDATYWFTDSGVMRTQTAREILGPRSWSLLFYLPSETWVVQVSLGMWIVHGVMMLVGFYSRVQATAIFMWLVSFQNRNPSIHDGEDTVFRIFAFLMIWLPLDAYWSIRRLGKNSESGADQTDGRSNAADAWGLRLFQVQMTAIYVSTALSKFEGSTWNDGTAVWYVSRMTDNFGRWIPPKWLDYPYASELATYGTLAIECFLPFGLWIPRLRWIAIGLGILLHLGIEFSMNLFLFQWVMILGLLTFVRLPSRTWSCVQETAEG